MADTDTRPLRVCDSCGGVDDSPRHGFVTRPGDGETNTDVLEKALENADSTEGRRAVLLHARDNSFVLKHFDCCAADGCPDAGRDDAVSCDELVAEAKGAKDGDLLEFLVNRTAARPARGARPGRKEDD